ncbi:MULTISPECIES: nucleotidyltransferase domain-containing protein [Anaerococcus]|uniref:Polymerase nucleotidyl transferase domain-containing protein n=2 Tax=Anaerococcus TaxID=165779 RepID=A0A3E2TJT2_9FIRM|nr:MULTISPECIES: nucleotidyltransferase domain-containing protein [Anaerococcus]MDU2566408.1 nucleotidyltransferase domain-containing protein [Anaerococcus sp.]RGB77235.1 hypothetical protein DXA39_03175 [Anaerococcus nagyae]
MINQQKIITYLKEKYNPLTIALYGSYADGTYNQNSDFDCLIIVKYKDYSHDDHLIDNVRLDCFIYTEDEIKTKSIEEFITIYKANIIYDTGIGKQLKSEVEKYVDSFTYKDKEFLVSWIKKTLWRIGSVDDDSNFRAITFLSESLEDYCLLRDIFYFGSKKSIKYLKKEDKIGYNLFYKAISTRTNDSIIDWGEHIIQYK